MARFTGTNPQRLESARATDNAGGEITECEPPRRLAVTSVLGTDASLVSIDLRSTGDDTTELTLQHRVASRSPAV